ncbi:MAG TPA: hypothetical protein VM029_02640 [Opitutaceae bacterium]|nr:hypothetical protein [Opitutaceae bacterium]
MKVTSSSVGFLLSALAALTLGLAGCATSPTRSATVIQPPAPPGLPRPPALRIPNIIRVHHEPPAPLEPQEAPTSAQPHPEAVWVPGFYTWRENQYAWTPGTWQRPPDGRTTWVAPRVERRGDNEYVFTEGYWR